MFPDQIHADAHAYAAGYFAELGRSMQAIDLQKFDAAARLLSETFKADRALFAFGNGGSAAISNHLLCDHMKGIQTDTNLKPRVVSLSSHIELITAIANDISYDDVFHFQLRTMARTGDAVIAISSSGNSENIVRALTWAKENGVRSIAMTGFSGGRAAGIADVNIHVPCHNYGIVEDLHQACMHILAQYLRMSNMDPNLVTQRKF